MSNDRVRHQRLFFALWPDERVRTALVQLTRALSGCRGRPVPETNLHITAAFVGVSDVKAYDCLQARAAAVKATSFLLALSRIGYFRRSRILWLGADNCPTALTDLAQQLNSCLIDCGFAPDSRPYRPHVTLLRDAAPAPCDVQIATLKWYVDSFCLVASEIRPQGVRYEILRHFDLRV